MHGPALSGWLMVALCAVTGVYCLLRMRACAGEERRTAGGEAVMGFGMAFMALPAAVLTPPGWSWMVYAAVFGATALHGLAAVRHGGHHVHHLMGSLAMVYMAVAMAAPGSAGAHAGHTAAGAGGIPVLTGGLLLYYAVYVLRAGAGLVPVTAGGPGNGPAGGADRTGGPEMTLACRLSMALGMVAMLVTL
ncbi:MULTISPECIES: DUF5134 domain-containing protein [Streptomyces]|uniref:DUF5134 domain-containing protein n=2 Tax=Streptomyces cinereoruber TaxID=67260 RepID=A0ABX6B886_9ACTN|nr:MULTISPECIES: DUF5134 domain-containing protein [Streptomyces]MBB4160604.1 hypothetical protein [Streptomyces cinereoruber]MBY8819196.1 DUF5134 domain-containing protein [Streptomyces cinereoruber]NIH62877.1 hypothetical protein [Streptomyces cinereoruber]PVC68464.1 DUF5134 domain-containing protein [Streptomyces sp. CS081A]QEV31547.1 DUF5134 domain-containing protein [Streptomyces cinereoruber]